MQQRTEETDKHEHFNVFLGDTQLNMDQINQKSRKLHAKISHCNYLTPCAKKELIKIELIFKLNEWWYLQHVLRILV